LLKSRSLWQNIRTFSESKTIPPDFIDPKKLSDVIDNAVTEDDKFSTGDQVAWPSKTHHSPDEAQELLSRPKRQKRSKKTIPVLDEDHSDCSIILFPGQGCQYVGMGQKALDKAPSTKLLFDQASSILGYDLLKLCLNGPKEVLDKTEHCQIAVVVASLAAVEVLWEMDEDAVKNCVATAGFSVGEITSLIFSGALTFEDGVKLVNIRQIAMQQASDIAPSGMMTIFFPASAEVELACDAARKWVKEKNNIYNPVCNVANHLYAGGKVLAGHVECLDFIEANKNDFRIRKCKRLPVSGAFHTKIMDPATGPFEEFLNSLDLSDPRIPVYSNFDHQIYRDVRSIKRYLPKQLTHQVKWEGVVNHLFKYKTNEQWPRLIECGPGNSLTAINKQISGKIAKKSSTVPA